MPSARLAARSLALCAEALLLAHVAALGTGDSAALAAGACALAYAGRVRPLALEALAFGGLGMTLGWWADLGFASLAPAGAAAVPPGAWCSSAGALAGVQLASWMNAGMLAGAGIAARVAGCSMPRFAVESAGMLLGMHAAARFLAPLALTNALAVVVPHAAMSAGMLAGMQLARVDEARVALGRALVARRPLRAPRPLFDFARLRLAARVATRRLPPS